MKRVLMFAVFLLVLVSLAAGDLYLLVNLQKSLGEYQPDGAALTSITGARPVPGDGPAEIVVLVVIDGLRHDISKGMQFLNHMRHEGAHCAAKTGQPSYSKPGYAVISSGAFQDDTGIVFNDDAGPLVIDTVFRSARRSGLGASLAAHDWWVELNGEDAFQSAYSYRDEECHDPQIDMRVRDSALAALGQDGPNLLLVHFMLTDTAGHDEGALSSRYLGAAKAIDGYICEIATAMDLERHTLIVTADHGHLGRNTGGGSGHGGWEQEIITVPFLMIGAGVKPGKISSPMLQTDIAPTIAALLNLQVPASATGSVIWDSLDVDAGYRDSFDAADQDRNDAALARSLAKAMAVREGQRNRNLRVFVVIAAIMAALALIRPKVSSALARLALMGACVYVLIYWLAYSVLLGNVFSLSTFPNAQILTIFRIIGLPSVAALAVACVALIWTAEWRVIGCPVKAMGAIVAGVAITLIVAIAAGYVVNGFVVTWPLPDFRVGFFQLSAMLQFGVVGFLAWIPLTGAWLLASRGRKP